MNELNPQEMNTKKHEMHLVSNKSFTDTIDIRNDLEKIKGNKHRVFPVKMRIGFWRYVWLGNN